NPRAVAKDLWYVSTESVSDGQFFGAISRLQQLLAAEGLTPCLMIPLARRRRSRLGPLSKWNSFTTYGRAAHATFSGPRIRHSHMAHSRVTISALTRLPKTVLAESRVPSSGWTR